MHTSCSFSTLPREGGHTHYTAHRLKVRNHRLNSSGSCLGCTCARSRHFAGQTARRRHSRQRQAVGAAHRLHAHSVSTNVFTFGNCTRNRPNGILGLDTDTVNCVELTVKTFLSHIITREFNFPVNSLRTSYVRF
eukprot:1981942-Pyramimonas_sp.AAC.1